VFTVKLSISLLSILFGVLASATQLEFPLQEPAVEILKIGWSKERINWEGDPFGGPVENFDEMRSRARNEKRIDDAKRGGGGGSDRVKREAKADEANLAKQREKSPPRYVFVYKAKLKNHEPTAIASIDWDYIFFERGTTKELGRQQFTSDEQISPGKTKELSVTVISPPTRTVSVMSLNLNEHDQFSEKVVLVRIKYADGRVWEASQ
jgi:hypothetical protein